jgi:transglutaminase-like putative cysteine protease
MTAVARPRRWHEDGGGTMKILPRFLYLFCFLGMAVAAALSLDRALQPSMSAILLRAVIVGGVLGAAGLVHRKAWGVSLVLLPVGAYVLFRTVLLPGAGVEGIGGLYHFYVQAFATGAEQYAAKFFPLDLAGAPELRLLLAVIVYCLTGVASFFALSLRRPIWGVTLVLLLLGFSFTVDTIPRVLVLAVLFLVFAFCALVLSRSLERRTWRLRDAVPGVLVGAAGAALAVVLLGAAPSAAATPWEDWREWNPFNQGSSIYSFNWLQNYPQLLNPANNVVIMKVESSKPSYWRANALDEFTGQAWVSSQGFLQEITRTRETAGYVFSIPPADPPPAGQTVTERFQVRSVYTNYFFTGGDPLSLTMDQDIVLHMNEMRSLHVVNALGPSLDYTLKAVIPKVTPSSLVALGSAYPAGMDRYLDLPFPRVAQLAGTDKDAAFRDAVSQASANGAQWAGLYVLNQSIVGGATDPYEIALRLERYLRQTYQYTLQPPPSDFSSPYAAFLFDTHAGYCQHFAGAMALLLRFNGVPARVAVGFTSGEVESAGVYSVSTNNAHAWVEAYFPTAGWVAFDPTPGRNLPNAGASSTSPGFKDPFASSQSGSTTGTTEASTDPFPNRPAGGTGTTEDSSPSWISHVPWLPWVLGVIVLLVGWPVGRKLWRERGLRHGTLTQRFAASLRLLRGALSTYGVAATRSSAFEEVLDLIEEHVGLERDPLLAARAGAVLFGGRRARPEDLERAEAFRREVERELRKQHGWLKTTLSWYWAPQEIGRRPGQGAPARSPARAVRGTPGVDADL